MSAITIMFLIVWLLGTLTGYVIGIDAERRRRR